MSADFPLDDRCLSPQWDSHRSNASYVLCESRVTPIEVETRHVVDGSASVTSCEELLGDRVMLKLGMPRFQGKLIDARVRHRSRYDRFLVSGEEETSFFCSLEFVRIWDESDVHPTLLAAFRTTSDDAEPDQEVDVASVRRIADALSFRHRSGCRLCQPIAVDVKNFVDGGQRLSVFRNW